MVTLEIGQPWMETFGQLGFSANEIKILQFLYQHKGSVKADQISEGTGVPLTRTYEALDNLSSSNFVIRYDGRPRKFEARSPQIALSQYIEEEERQLQTKLSSTRKLVNQSLELAQNLYIEHHTQIAPDELLEQFSNLEDAEAQTMQLIDEAETEILIFSHVFQWYYTIKDHLLEAVKRGCQVKVLMQTEGVDPATTYGSIDPIDVTKLTSQGIEVKNIPASEIKTRGTLVDRKYVVFVIWTDPQKSRERRIYRPQFSSNPGIVEVFYGYFNHLWE